MKRFIYITLLVLGFIQVKADGIYKSGYLNMGDHLYVIDNSDGEGLVMSISHSSVDCYHWTGSDWSLLSSKSLEHLDIVDGTASYLGDVSFQGVNYVAIEGVSRSSGSKRFHLLKISSTEITDISPDELRYAQDVRDLLIHENELLIAGVFLDGMFVNNLLALKDDKWNYKGKPLTRSLVSDYILDMQSYNGHVYACGSFVIKGKTYTVAYLEEGEWKPINYPPFINVSLKFGLYRDNLVLFGGDDNETDRVHMWDGRQWTTMSEGLSDYTIHELKEFVLYGDELYATGLFESDQSKSSVLKYNGEEWESILNLELDLFSAQQTSEGLLLTFRESDLKGYHFRNRLLIKKGLPVLYTGYFLDKANDCIYQASVDKVFSSVSEWYEAETMRFFADRDGEIAIPLKTASFQLESEFSNLYRLNCNLTRSRQLKAAAVDYLEPKRSLMIHESRAGANVILRPVLSWNIQNGQSNEFVLCVRNTGSAMLNRGELTINFSKQMSNLQSEWEPYKTTDSSASWEVFSLLAGEERCFSVWFDVTSDELKDVSIKANIQSKELDWQTDDDKSDEVRLNEGSHPESPIYKLSAQNEVLNQNTDVLDYKLVFRNETGQMVTHLRFLDTLDAQIRIDPRGIRYISNHPAEIRSSYFIDANGHYRYVLSWELSQLQMPQYQTDSKKGAAFVDFRVHLVHENEEMWEVCNQARVFVNQLEPQKTNVVCNSYSNRLTIHVTPAQASTIKVYPIPSSGSIQIESVLNEDVRFVIFDLQGREVESKVIQANQPEALEIQLDRGTYFLRTDRGETRRILIH